MVDLFLPMPGETRRRIAWSSLREWLDEGNEQVFLDAVLHPAFVVANGIVADRRTAWDVTTEALDGVMAEVAPLLEGTGQIGRDLERVLHRAEVDGEPALCTLLRARLVPAAESAAHAHELQRMLSATQKPLAMEQAPRRVSRAITMDTGGPEDEAARHEAVSRVRDALASLSQRVRDTKLLAMDGWSQREIAERLSVSRGSVRKRLAVADQRLHEQLFDVWEDGFGC